MFATQMEWVLNVDHSFLFEFSVPTGYKDAGKESTGKFTWRAVERHGHLQHQDGGDNTTQTANSNRLGEDTRTAHL
jgi:hypothetical protein